MKIKTNPEGLVGAKIADLSNYALLYAVLVCDNKNGLPSIVNSELSIDDNALLARKENVTKSYTCPEAPIQIEIAVTSRYPLSLIQNDEASDNPYKPSRYCELLAVQNDIFCYPHENQYKAFCYYPLSDKIRFTVQGVTSSEAIAKAFVMLTRLKSSDCDCIVIPTDLLNVTL